MFFGKNDKTQDQQINDVWKWINTLNKNQAALIKNNNQWIQDWKWCIKSIKQLQAKDKQHDATDLELKAALKGIKDMAQAVEHAEQQAEAAKKHLLSAVGPRFGLTSLFLKILRVKSFL